MKNIIKLNVLLSVFILNTSIAQSSRQYIKDQINDWGTCKNVAITQKSGNLAIYDYNGWAGGGFPENLVDKLTQINKANQELDDVQITNTGKWIVLYDNNKIAWNNIAKGLQNKITEYTTNKSTILNVSFNDKNDWIIFTDTQVAASSQKIMDNINNGRERYGEIVWSHFSSKGLALVFENGFLFYGNVPEQLKTAVSSTKIDVKKLKFLDTGAYFITNNKGAYQYAL